MIKAILILSIFWCGGCCSQKQIRREYFYQYHLGKQEAYRDAGEFEKAQQEEFVLRQIQEGTYEGLR